MKKNLLFLLTFIILLLGSNSYAENELKKSKFNPRLDGECVETENIADGFVYSGYVCEHKNGKIFLRNWYNDFSITTGAMQVATQEYCDTNHKGKKAVNAGKANLTIFAKLDWRGIEFICS